MKTWYINLSKTQKTVLAIIILFAILLISFTNILNPKKSNLKLADFSYEKSIKYNAEKLGVTGKNFAKEMGLELSAPKTTPLNEMGISIETFNHAIEHLLGHKDSNIKYYIYFSIFLFSLVYLIYLGKPKKLQSKQIKKTYPKSVYIGILIISVLISGFFLGKSPNPMEGIVKVFKSMVGLYPDPLNKSLAFIFFILLAIIGNKIICGWACPFGALQELLYSIPILKKVKRIKLPFIITNLIRALLFILMLGFLFGILGDKKGFVVYHYINPFNLFNFDFDSFTIILTIIFSLTLGLFFYRPYCSLICPFGFVSWLTERISIFKVKINYDLCTKCNACIKTCPSSATKGIVNKKIFYADCFSCTRCLNICPENAIEYKSVFSKKR